jgi:hypothetical protein
MIFYTLQGLKYKIEIHDEKIKLIKRNFIFYLNFDEVIEYSLSELAQFSITYPKYLLGEIKWTTFNGDQKKLSFTSNVNVAVKIERYMHKLVFKNYQRKQKNIHLSNGEKKSQHFFDTAS